MLELVEEKTLVRLAGSPKRKRQMEWLRQNRITYLVGLDEKPKVSVLHLETIMGGRKISAKPVIEPDFDALKRSMHG